jgi:hypothetical protein
VAKAVIFYLLPLGIGAVLLLLGLVMFKRVARDGAMARGGCLGFALMVAGGVIALAGLITAPTPWERQRRLDGIFRTPAERIERIVITPGRPGTYKPLVKSPVVIDDPPRLKRIAAVLRDAREVSPSHPRATWTAHVELMTEKETFRFNVSATDDAGNGTLVNVGSYSDGGGWSLGIFRADGLEKIFEDAASAVGRRRSD